MAYVDKEWTEKQFETFSQKVSESFVRKDSPEAIGKDGITPEITATATVDNGVGTPSVTVIKSGSTATPTFAFNFSNLKGMPGEKGDNGVTPHIDPTTKHWFIGDTDTSIIAEGKDGDQGYNLTLDGNTLIININNQ